jgi:hypothetical protein
MLHSYPSRTTRWWPAIPFIAIKEAMMFRIPDNLAMGIAALGLSFALAVPALAASPPRTDVKIEAKDIKDTASPAARLNPQMLKSLSAAHAADVHPYVATPDTKDRRTLRIESK